MNDTDDWYDVEQVHEHAYRLTETENYGMFIVTGEDQAVVIDAGAGVGDLRALAEALVDGPVALLLTHSHWDHIGAAAQFEPVYVDERELAPNGEVAIDGLSDEFVFRPGQFTEEWLADGNEFPDGFDPEGFTIEPVSPEAVETIGPGDSIDLGDRRLEIHEIPGHSPGQVAVLDREMGDLYGGDVVHMEAGLYMHFKHCDINAYVETFERLIELRDSGGFDRLLTSHNPDFTGDDLVILDRLLEGLEEILADELEYEIVETEWGDAREYNIHGSPVFTKPSIT